MAWTTPRTWQAGELVTHTLLNEQLKNNLDALKRTASVAFPNSNVTTTSGSLVDIPGFSVTLTTVGGNVLVMAQLHAQISATGNWIIFNIAQDGTGASSTQVVVPSATNLLIPVTVLARFSAPTAGSHTYKLRWAVSGGATASFNPATYALTGFFLAVETW